MSKEQGTLLLLPNVLGDVAYHEPFLPSSIDKAVAGIDGLIAESEGGGRRFLGRFPHEKKRHMIPLALLNKRSDEEQIDFLLEPMQKGETWGLVSDAGLPCVADPGYTLVRRARLLGIRVKAFIGPSSLMMALMLSGLPGQRFSSHGYLPKDVQERTNEIKKLEKVSKESQSTQLFIEAPHRNAQLLDTMLETLAPTTWLCVAWELTLPGQGVVVQQVGQWKKTPLPNIQKKPAVFLIYAGD